MRCEFIFYQKLDFNQNLVCIKKRIMIYTKISSFTGTKVTTTFLLGTESTPPSWTGRFKGQASAFFTRTLWHICHASASFTRTHRFIGLTSASFTGTGIDHASSSFTGASMFIGHTSASYTGTDWFIGHASASCTGTDRFIGHASGSCTGTDWFTGSDSCLLTWDRFYRSHIPIFHLD